MNPMVHLVLLGEKRLEIEQERRSQHRPGQDAALLEGWSKPQRRSSILFRLPRLQLHRRQPECACVPEPGC